MEDQTRVILNPHYFQTISCKKYPTLCLGRSFKKVLLVDDDLDILNYMGEMLHDNDIDCKLAVSAIDALEKLRSNKISLIVTDIMMPHINGREFIKLLKNSNTNIPVIVLSGFPQYGKFLNSSECDGFLEKPVNENEFLNSVFSVLENSEES